MLRVTRFWTAAKGNPGLASGGRLLRDHYGNWSKGFSVNFGFCSSVKIELLALLTWLRLAWSLDYRQLEVELDSHVAIQLIQQPCKDTQTHYLIIQECTSIIHKKGWVVKI